MSTKLDTTAAGRFCYCKERESESEREREREIMSDHYFAAILQIRDMLQLHATIIIVLNVLALSLFMSNNHTCMSEPKGRVKER